MKNNKIRPGVLVLSLLFLTSLVIGSCGGGGGGGDSSGPPLQINNCTGGPMQGTWVILVKWDNGDKNFNGIFKVCEDGDDLTFYNPCNAEEEVGYGLIRGQQISIIIRGTTAYEGSLTGGNTIVVPLTNPQGIHGNRYIIRKSTGFLRPVGELKVQGTLDGVPINFIQNPACATEIIQGNAVSYGIGYPAYTGRTFTFSWNNLQPPTTIQFYAIPNNAQATFLAGSSTNPTLVGVQSGNIKVASYTQRYSGPDSGISGLYEFIFSGSRGQVHGSFTTPFFGLETDPFADLP